MTNFGEEFVRNSLKNFLRSGANFVGWFNFVFNALYIGSCVKSLASVRDAMDVYAERLDADYIKYTYPALHQFKYDADACTKVYETQ